MTENELIQKVVKTYREKDNLKKVAEICEISRAKARRILIGEGLMTSPITEEVMRLMEDGMELKDIAARLGRSVSSISEYIPYQRTMYSMDDKSDKALQDEGYRKMGSEYTRSQNTKFSESGVGRSEVAKAPIENDVSMQEKKEPVLLHMELADGPLMVDQVETLRKYGGVKGNCISRDILVPGDIQLWALHYVIQVMFGWQNCHDHAFYIRRIGKLDDEAALFRSPDAKERDDLWADDYRHGSPRNWVRSKYTGPYVNGNKSDALAVRLVDSKLDFRLIEGTDITTIFENTSVLEYTYDFSALWPVMIKKSEEKITKKHKKKCMEEYRPVVVKADGYSVFDEATNIAGYCAFLNRAFGKDEQKDSWLTAQSWGDPAESFDDLGWARSQGWEAKLRRLETWL